MVLGMSLHAQNQPANVAGNWEMTLTIPQGSLILTFSIEQEGSSIKGKMSSQMTGESAIEGTVNGNDLTFGSNLNTPNGVADATFKGTVSGDSIKGTMVVEDFLLDWTAMRAK